LTSTLAEVLLTGFAVAIPRIKVTWTSVLDSRVMGYDLQFKLSTDTVWQNAPSVLGQNSNTAWLDRVMAGQSYDVQLRSASNVREVSAWVTITGFTVFNQLAAPPNVTGFSASQQGVVVAFNWKQVSDYSLKGYDIGFAPQGTTNWNLFTPLTEAAKGIEMTNASVPPGTWVFGIRARNLADQLSAVTAYFNLVVTNANPLISQAVQEKDWLALGPNYLSFDGVSGSYVTAADAASFRAGTGSFSAEAWVKYTVSVGLHAFLSNRSGTTNWWTAGIQNDQVVMELGNSYPTNYRILPGTTILNDGKPHHLVAVRDAALSQLRVYVDGKLEASISDLTAGLTLDNGAVPVRINDGAWGQAFNGLVGRVRFYKRVLTLDEIVAHSFGNFNDDTSLSLTWNFDEGSGTTVADASGNANTGTLVNAPLWQFNAKNFVKHSSGVLVPISTKRPSDYPIISPPAAPTLGTTSGGTLGATTYFVKVTYVSAAGAVSPPAGETLPSAEASQAVSLNNLLIVTSPGAATGASFYNVYVSTTTGTETKQNATPIALGVNWTEPASGLISGAALPTRNGTGFEPLDIFVPDPVASASYTAPTVDIGYDDSVRVFATEAATMGPGQSGIPALTLAIDTWLSAASDLGTFIAWVLGSVTFRFVRAQLRLAVTPGAVPYVTDFTPTVDKAPVIEHADSVVVGATGTAIVFPQPFHVVPNVQVTPISAGVTSASATAVTTTGFTAHVFNGATETGGTINWVATGE
jgi:hypothetical protein